MLAVGIPPILYDHASEPIARKKKGGREKNGSIRCGEGLTESTWPTLRPAIYSRLKAVSLNFITPPRNSRIYRDDKLEVTGSNRVCNPRCVQGWFIYFSFFFLFCFAVLLRGKEERDRRFWGFCSSSLGWWIKIKFEHFSSLKYKKTFRISISIPVSCFTFLFIIPQK